MKIQEIIENTGLNLYGSIKHENVDFAEYDSRKIIENSMFIAVKGFSSDGHDYIRKSVEDGANTIVIDQNRLDDFKDLSDSVNILLSDNTRKALSKISSVFYGDVSKKIPVIGITGTNGKTSTTYMIEAICKEAGYTPGVMGTINYRWKEIVKDAPNTTPESLDIQRMMAEMYSDDVDIIIMEVSSHGLDLGRVDDVYFKGAVFTNLSQDHLDYHKSFEEYFLAKRKLFDLLERGASENFAIVNIDDEYGQRLSKYCEEKNYITKTYSSKPGADYYPVPGLLEVAIDGVTFQLNAFDNKISMHTAGSFSLFNATAAAATADNLNINADSIKKGLENLKSVPGRFDSIKSDAGFGVIVDYAHTEDALVKLLDSAREITSNNLVTVFGCGGDRDKTKRPLMGQAACSRSDKVIVTSDNPRTEDPLSIISDIERGIQEYKDLYSVIADREQAIAKAIQEAEKGDVIVIAGKGHENYQIIGKEKIHFDDKEIAEKYIKQVKC